MPSAGRWRDGWRQHESSTQNPIRADGTLNAPPTVTGSSHGLCWKGTPLAPHTQLAKFS